MELALVLLVLFPLRADVLVNAFTLNVNAGVDLIEVSLLVVVGLLDLRVAGTESSELLDFRGKSVLLVFDFTFDLDDQLVELLERFTLGVIELLLELGDSFHLLFDVGEALDSVLRLEGLHDLISIFTTRFQNLFSSLEDDDFSLNFIKDLLHDLEVSVFDTQVGGVLLK